ncbi:hypothetical protein BH23PSE1_BH23PSE1_10100 [soil metagenome]
MNSEGPSSLSDHLGPVAIGFEWLVLLIELFAILILLIGLARFLRDFLSGEVLRGAAHARSHRLNLGRIELARHILAALEVFIVSDIIRTVLHLTLENVLLLGALVTVRSVISFFLERELRHLEREGRS